MSLGNDIMMYKELRKANLADKHYCNVHLKKQQ